VRSDGVGLHSEDGLRLAATTWRSADEPQAAVVVAHGLTITKDHPSVTALASSLVAEGFGVITYDGRGHGDSEGLCTLGCDEAFDVAAAVAYARTLSPRVVAVGSSMGAIAVLRYGATDPDLAGVVAVSAPARWRIHSARSFVAAAMTRTGAGRDLVRRRKGVRLAPRWNAVAAPEEVASRLGCPAAIVHGSADRFIPAREATRLYERLRGPRRLDVVPGMGHGFGRAAVPAIIDAVRWTITARGELGADVLSR
jgi:alpha-beta hydrolase superfamily lysophospholipase